MPPRLLTLLGLIETSLVNQGSRAVANPPSRAISFHKGVARMTFADGAGAIMLQNFTLADGQICVRAVFSWGAETEAGNYSIYPRDNFDWHAAADQIANAWLSGKPLPESSTPVQSVTESSVNEPTSSEQVVATG
ncbi:MAG: hypothetical protein QM790_15200 [Nibricoccus sp.]